MDPILANCYEHCRNLLADYRGKFDYNMIYFEVETGRKYYKIVMVKQPGSSVHCFVDKKTGDVFKAASWAAPAKGVRFNILRDMDILRNADWAGSYLYAR